MRETNPFSLKLLFLGCFNKQHTNKLRQCPGNDEFAWRDLQGPDFAAPVFLIPYQKKKKRGRKERKNSSETYLPLWLWAFSFQTVKK